MKAYGGSRGILPLIPNHSTTRTSVINFTPWPFYLQGKSNPGTHWEWCWVGPRARQDILEKKKISCPCWSSNPSSFSPSPSQSTN